MSYASGTPAPSPPTTYATFRSFYLVPTDPLPSKATAIDFFVGRAADGVTFENWQYLGRGDNITGLYWVHSGLDENTSYAYYIQYIFQDGSRGPVSGLAYAGRAQLIITSTLNIDQLASRAYATGLITSGIFRGTIFQTSVNDPRVQMDPTGIFATDGTATPVFYIYSDGSTAFFRGRLNPSEIDFDRNAAFIQWNYTPGSGGPVGRTYASIEGTRAAGPVSALQLQTVGLAGGFAGLDVFSDDTGFGDSVVARTASSFAQLTDNASNSSFLQLGGSIINAQLLSGAVTGATGLKRLGGVGNWTVARTALGVYTLTLIGGTSGVWTIPIVQCNEASGGVAEIDYVSLVGPTTTVTVKTFSGPFAFGAADINWSFIATATQN